MQDGESKDGGGVKKDGAGAGESAGVKPSAVTAGSGGLVGRADGQAQRVLGSELPFILQKRPFWTFYCPLCSAERRSFYWPKPQLKHYIQLTVFTIFWLVVLYPLFGVKGVFVSLPIWVLFEFFYRARARQSLICPHCGFDPYLYKFDPKLAKERVKEFFGGRGGGGK